MMDSIREESVVTPVVHTCDVCVVGGSCTGVFAAVRAARLGARVAVIENSGFFGGVATAGLVNVWHTVYDTGFQSQIIAGLTTEVIDRLDKRGAVLRKKPSEHLHFVFNSPELMAELDSLVSEAGIQPFLHARFVRPVVEDGRMTHAVVEDKSGRRAIRATCFVDATGDGDVIARMGLPFTRNDDLQPPTACVILSGMDQVRERNPSFDLGSAVHDPRYPNALHKGFLWHAEAVGIPGAWMVAGTRIHNADCSDAGQLTRAEMEGRRQARAIRDIVHDHFEGGDGVQMAALPAYIGIRETRHAVCEHRLTEMEVLEGVRFPDAIANGSYRVDVHHSEKAGLTFRYLNGTEAYAEPGQPTVRGRWREARDKDPTFYQIPYRSLLPKGTRNVLVAGRLTDADRGAYGAIRVMVNCNQTGEAAGVAAVLALDKGGEVGIVPPNVLRKNLRDGGSAVI
jgi:hypothetical protein